METGTMIRQLRRTAKKHENDKLYTFDTNISLMCTDVANRLEELEKEKQEIKARAIDEFAERFIYKAVCEGCSGCCNCYEEGKQSECEDWKSYMEIAEEMRGAE